MKWTVREPPPRQLIVRDEGTPMVETPSANLLAFNFDHLSLYLGLFDIGERAGSHISRRNPGSYQTSSFIIIPTQIQHLRYYKGVSYQAGI